MSPRPAGLGSARQRSVGAAPPRALSPRPVGCGSAPPRPDGAAPRRASLTRSIASSRGASPAPPSEVVTFDSILGAEPDGLASFDASLLEFAVEQKAQQSAAFGLDVAEGPPSDVTLWVIEVTARAVSAASTPRVTQSVFSSGAPAMKELLEPRKIGEPGARVIIGEVS